jgi:hypothetical protein
LTDQGRGEPSSWRADGGSNEARCGSTVFARRSGRPSTIDDRLGRRERVFWIGAIISWALPATAVAASCAASSTAIAMSS